MKLLVVVDMQNDFVTGSLRNEDAIKIVPNVAEKIKEIKKEGNYVWFTKDTHYDDYLDTQEGKKLPIEHCISGSYGHEIIPELKDLSRGCFQIQKPTFGSIQLAEMISHKQFDEVIFIGVCTDICVISNALLLKAFDQSVNVTVDASCCAGLTIEKHKAALETMKSCQIEVINE